MLSSVKFRQAPLERFAQARILTAGFCILLAKVNFGK